jgi:FkbM family methyltransferase
MMKLILKSLNKLLGKMRFQKYFEFLFEMSLKGLNYGNGGNFKESGELNVLKYIGDKFKEDKAIVIFDVGANAGNYSKALSDFYNSKATIHAFEPSKKTYEIFLETTKNLSHIIPNNLGLSDIENYQLLYSSKDGSGLASVYHRKLDHFGISMDQSEEIKLSTIDAYCQINKIDKINFLKLDIEGHELKALNGATQMIKSNKIDAIQFEFGGCNIDSRTYFQDFFYLLKDKYKIYRILKDGLLEMPTYKESYEIFITINYLALRK